MRFYTMEEFENMKVYKLDDVTYRLVEKAFISRLGEKLGKKILVKFLEKSVKELTCQSYVDVMSLITIL